MTLDLKQLLAQTQERAGVGGRLADKLPADAAQITILKSDELGLAQDLVDFFERFVVVLVLLTFGLYALAVYLARGWRREALRACGVGFVVAGAGVLIARSLAGDVVVDELATTEAAHEAVEATWTISTSLLDEAASAMLGYGIVLLLAAWVAGPSKWAVSVRRWLAPVPARAASRVRRHGGDRAAGAGLGPDARYPEGDPRPDPDRGPGRSAWRRCAARPRASIRTRRPLEPRYALAAASVPPISLPASALVGSSRVSHSDSSAASATAPSASRSASSCASP